MIVDFILKEISELTRYESIQDDGCYESGDGGLLDRDEVLAVVEKYKIKELQFKKIEQVMMNSLVDPEKKKTLPVDWQSNNFDIRNGSHTRALIRHFAYHIELEIVKINKED